MTNFLDRKRNITPEKAIKILSENGLDIDKKDAQEVLDILYFLAKLIVRQNFKK